MYVQYWTTQSGFTSSLEMKNNLVSDPLTVAISVYVAAGEFPVKTITLAPRQTTVLDLNSAIQATAIPRDVREGTLEVEFTGPNPLALMGSISVTNLEQGIAWNFFLYPRRTDAEAEAAPLRSVFWLPSNQADGFVAGQNVSESNLTLTPVFQIEGRSYPLAAMVLGPEQGFKLELRKELRRLGLANVRAGGIQLSYQGEPDGLKAHGALFDGNGFSAEMDFLRYQQADPGQTFYLRTPRFAIGPADAMLGLPRGHPIRTNPAAAELSGQDSEYTNRARDPQGWRSQRSEDSTLAGCRQDTGSSAGSAAGCGPRAPDLVGESGD
jgi:hypothetical protein